MPTTVKINPVTRIEGHLEVEVIVDSVGGEERVVDAHAGSPMFRGFERILLDRDPRDAVHLTQRVCGVCPVSHGLASSRALEDACSLEPTAAGRTIRNLVLASNYVQSHILHFYHLALPDWVDLAPALPMSPWSPRHPADDLLTGDAANRWVGRYVEALDMRRKAHRLGAIFGGRLPTTASFVPGGATPVITEESLTAFRELLAVIRTFVEEVHVPDAEELGTLFPRYSELGSGCGNLLSFGVFDLDAEGNRLLERGRLTGGELASVEAGDVREFVSRSWYAPETSDLSPADGETVPDAGKEGAYSWIKAPRYAGEVHEVGPLARLWVNGDYRRGISVMDRLVARAHESAKVIGEMEGWLDRLAPGDPVYRHGAIPDSGEGVGLTEAPRGALGHWVRIAGGKIARYQLVTPTGWNVSPRDDAGQPGALEQALLGVPVADARHPLEVLRVVHSFDPCVACSVHAVRPRRGRVRPVSRSRKIAGRGEEGHVE